jgi:hypothetical protein
MDQSGEFTSLEKQAQVFYEEKLKDKLEREHMGKAVAIHVDTGDYAVGKNHIDAFKLMPSRSSARVTRRLAESFR